MLLCFRDHAGYGLIHFRDHPDGFYVATEPKQVVAGTGLTKEPDLDVVEQILFKTYDRRTPSALQGVSRLPKASVLVADPRGVRVRRYWHPEGLLESARLTPTEVQERFDQLMSQALRRTVTGSESVALWRDRLSRGGGVRGARASAGGRRSAACVLGRVSVIPERGRAAVHGIGRPFLGMPLHLYEQRSRPLDDVQEWAALADGPVPTVSLPLYKEHYLKARSLGGSNILTGEVAELVSDLTMFRFPHLLLHGRVEAVRRDLTDRHRRGASAISLARSLVSAFTPTSLTARRWRRRTGAAPGWIDARRANETAVQSIVPARERWSKVQVSWIEGVGVSMEADEICQDLCGVRNRRPWTDVDLWEFFLSLRAEVKYPDARSKTLVRRLLRGKLPDPILDRRDKTAFDDVVMASVDYETLRRWLLAPSYHVPGVHYDLLRERLEHRDMDINDVMWAKDLASIHAFLALW